MNKKEHNKLYWEIWRKRQDENTTLLKKRSVIIQEMGSPEGFNPRELSDFNPFFCKWKETRKNSYLISVIKGILKALEIPYSSKRSYIICQFLGCSHSEQISEHPFGAGAFQGTRGSNLELICKILNSLHHPKTKKAKDVMKIVVLKLEERFAGKITKKHHALIIKTVGAYVRSAGRSLGLKKIHAEKSYTAKQNIKIEQNRKKITTREELAAFIKCTNIQNKEVPTVLRIKYKIATAIDNWLKSKSSIDFFCEFDSINNLAFEIFEIFEDEDCEGCCSKEIELEKIEDENEELKNVIDSLEWAKVELEKKVKKLQAVAKRKRKTR